MRGERFVRNVAPGLSGRVIVTSMPSPGLTIPLVDKTFTPDGAASAIKDGITNTNSHTT